MVIITINQRNTDKKEVYATRVNYSNMSFDYELQNALKTYQNAKIVYKACNLALIKSTQKMLNNTAVELFISVVVVR